MPGARALKNGRCVDTPVPWTKYAQNIIRLRKGLDYQGIGDKFEVGASTFCEKVNKSGTDENLFKLVPRHDAQICTGAPRAQGLSYPRFVIL